eukprot:3326909-Alexandrium_andersonii.AAC.1
MKPGALRAPQHIGSAANAALGLAVVLVALHDATLAAVLRVDGLHGPRILPLLPEMLGIPLRRVVRRVGLAEVALEAER